MTKCTRTRCFVDSGVLWGAYFSIFQATVNPGNLHRALPLTENGQAWIPVWANIERVVISCHRLTRPVLAQLLFASDVAANLSTEDAGKGAVRREARSSILIDEPEVAPAARLAHNRARRGGAGAVLPRTDGRPFRLPRHKLLAGGHARAAAQPKATKCGGHDVQLGPIPQFDASALLERFALALALAQIGLAFASLFGRLRTDTEAQPRL
eukprot:scaffold85723_cov72-Phaeocystis_antarctica.AAC.2